MPRVVNPFCIKPYSEQQCQWSLKIAVMEYQSVGCDQMDNMNIMDSGVMVEDSTHLYSAKWIVDNICQIYQSGLHCLKPLLEYLQDKPALISHEELMQFQHDLQCLDSNVTLHSDCYRMCIKCQLKVSQPNTQFVVLQRC